MTTRARTTKHTSTENSIYALMRLYTLVSELIILITLQSPVVSGVTRLAAGNGIIIILGKNIPVRHKAR